MATLSLEERMSMLESRLEQIERKQHLDQSTDRLPWWEKIRGRFKDDPAYEEAMRLGREWRESLRPDDGMESLI